MEQFEALIKELGAHSIQEYPNECVGIITKDFQYIRCKNISDLPKTTFILDPAALVKHDGNIWGIFHSHPGSDNPIPSIEDKTSAAFSQYKFLVGFSTKIFIYWLDKRVNALKFEPFEERHIASNY
jgi:proteasome lid subunit RPN8/RPN11